ncbi:hypothetical protein [Pseudolactococcus hodotermopsidis]|nr:hypothetical protein [Lactococcus hodotermopsidis]
MEENPAYKAKSEEISKKEEELKKINNLNNELKVIRKSLDSLKDSKDEAMGDNNGKFSKFSKEFLEIQEKINTLLEKEEEKKLTVQDLSKVKQLSELYTQLSTKTETKTEPETKTETETETKTEPEPETGLILPTFREVVDKEAKSNLIIELFDAATELIGSEFAPTAIQSKKALEKETTAKYNALTEAVTTLNSINGKEEIDKDVLTETYEMVEYRDALSLAFGYLVEKDEQLKAWSRVFYACLSDGLVLLIGLSMRRKDIFKLRVKNRRDLTNEEPLLIRDALYNLAALPITEDKKEIGDLKIEELKPETLINRLNNFLSCFELEPNIKDANLKMSYNLVCKDFEKKKTLEAEYKELTGVLQILRYIKPISVEQYDFFTKYKLNKATHRYESEDLKLELKGESTDRYESEDLELELKGESIDYYYIMTEGCQLFLYETINDLIKHVESKEISENFKKDFSEHLEKDLEKQVKTNGLLEKIKNILRELKLEKK